MSRAWKLRDPVKRLKQAATVVFLAFICKENAIFSHQNLTFKVQTVRKLLYSYWSTFYACVYVHYSLIMLETKMIFYAIYKNNNFNPELYEQIFPLKSIDMKYFIILIYKIVVFIAGTSIYRLVLTKNRAYSLWRCLF